MNHLSIIICTKDRPKDLDTLFRSIQIQTRKPDLIIVVDGSDEPVKHVVDKFDEFNIDYFTVRPPSLPKQRNAGIARLPKDTDWVGFLDDDLVLEKNSFEEIENVSENFKTSKPLGGIGMTITNVPMSYYSKLKGLFFLDNPKDGFFTISGCPGMVRQSDQTVEVQWLSGGVTFWKKDTLDDFSFDEWFDGTGYLEDVDFSYAVSQKYALAYSGKSRCQHFHHPVSKSKMISLGVWQITAWWYFVKKFGSFNILATFWSMFGLTLNNLVFGILRPSNFRFRKFLGNIKGFFLIFLGQATVQRNWQK